MWCEPGGIVIDARLWCGPMALCDGCPVVVQAEVNQCGFAIHT